MRARIAIIAAVAATFPLAGEPVSFSRDIKPLLVRQCTACHQPQSKQADLILTSYEGFQKGGRKGAAFVAGKPDASVVMSYLTGATQPRMPLGGQLKDDQIDLFKRWIAEGAKDDSGATVSRVPAKPAVYRSAPPVTAFAFSPDGKSIAVSGHHEILLTSVEGKLLARLPGRSMRIHSVAFTPDGKRLAAVGGDPAALGEVQIWNLESRKLEHSIEASTDTLFGGSISPDGKLVACGAADKVIR
ncbi:MAG: c-type cytochrome domain-containing protein, partial [Bryobacteraceae bacterium]